MESMDGEWRPMQSLAFVWELPAEFWQAPKLPTVRPPRRPTTEAKFGRPRSTAITTRSSATAEIAQVGGHYTFMRSFKVTYFGTNRKPVCDFLLVNNTNLRPISHRLTAYTVIIAFEGVYIVNARSLIFSVISENVAMSYVAEKTILDYIFCRQYGSIQPLLHT